MNGLCKVLMQTLVIATGTLAATDASAANEALDETARQIGMAPTDLRQRLGDCDGNQSTMNICAQYFFVEQDLNLNAVYQRAVARQMNARTKAKLVAGQRAWIRYRDLDCSYESSGVFGGTMHAMVELNCKRDLTKERIERLKTFLACTSPGCPGEW